MLPFNFHWQEKFLPTNLSLEMNPTLFAGIAAMLALQSAAAENGMDKMWGESTVKRLVNLAERVPPLSGAVHRFRVFSSPDDLEDPPTRTS